MKKEELRQEVKGNFYKLYREKKMSEDLAEYMVRKAEQMEEMELQNWLRDTKKELEQQL